MEDGGDGDHLRGDMHRIVCVACLLAGWWRVLVEEAGGVVDEFVVRV